MSRHPLHRVVWIPLLLSAGASCFKLDNDDCHSSLTCPGQLLAEYEAKLGKSCADCLRESCVMDLRACERDVDCKQAAFCQLEDSPSAYQKCLSELYASDASSIDDPTGAFEGKLGGFGKCLDTQQCSTCKRPDWTCENSDSECAITGEVDLVVSVQYFDEIRVVPANDVEVSLCGSSECLQLGTTDAGLVHHKESRGTGGGTYFRLKAPLDASSACPPTLFYPGCVGTAGPQPVPLYIVRNKYVGVANLTLAARNEVFSEVGQSIILPMSCRSAPGHDRLARGVKIGIRGRPLPLCKHKQQLPCIWYGDSSYGLPDLDEEDTSAGKAAGIAGLEHDSYDLVACHEDKLVAERRGVLMEKGKLTIARMLPFTGKNADDSVCANLEAPSPSTR